MDISDNRSSFMSNNPRKSIMVKQSFILDKENFTIDFLILGNWAVGKTSIIQTYLQENGQVDPNTISTSSLDVYQKALEGQNQPTIRIFDTPGKDIYLQDLVRQLKDYHRFQAVIYVFDLNSRSSFQQIKQWTQKIKIQIPLRIFLVGNKCDLQRVVKPQQAISMAKQIGAYAYYESSTKMQIQQKNENCFAKNTFYEIIDDIIITLNEGILQNQHESIKTNIYQKLSNSRISIENGSVKQINSQISSQKKQQLKESKKSKSKEISSIKIQLKQPQIRNKQKKVKKDFGCHPNCIII